jgi:sugar/nucleoside kinase (ribokinase family)
MLEYLIYGKIIIDDIQLADGQVVCGVLGGGGPQAAFGARLWADSVGLLSRSGVDIEAEHIQTLANLHIDLQGWRKYPNIPTPRTHLRYDEHEYMRSEQGSVLEMVVSREDWYRLLAQELTLPPTYQQPRLIHLITEFYDEPMVQTALELRRQGAIFSLEPLIDYQHWTNKEALLSLLPQVDIVTPDWPSASGIAASDDPQRVMQYWSKLGPALVAIRRGRRGSYVWDNRRDQVWRIPPLPVKVVDPTGAGNSYGGGLGVGWVEHGDARVAGCYGAISAKFLIEQAGIPPLSEPLQVEAQALLEPALDSARKF